MKGYKKNKIFLFNGKSRSNKNTTAYILTYQAIPWKVAPQQSFPPLYLMKQSK